MGVRAVRIGWGSTRAAAQDALLVVDLNADGSRGAGDGRIDTAGLIRRGTWSWCEGAMRAGPGCRRRVPCGPQWGGWPRRRDGAAGWATDG
jgi:hypothetical protein